MLNGKKFLERTAAIIYDKSMTKILIFTYMNKDYWLLPGGRVDQMEDSLSAIKREIKEKLNIELNFKLIAVSENIVNKINTQSINFYYKAVLNSEINEEYITPIENKKQIYKWIKINELDNYNLKPIKIKEIIQNVNSDELTHFIEID